MKTLLTTTALILSFATPVWADDHAEDDICEGIADGEMTEDGIMCPQEDSDGDSDAGDDEDDDGDDDDGDGEDESDDEDDDGGDNEDD